MSAPSARPFLDRATVARFVVEDFPLDEWELHVVDSRPSERYRLEDCLREVVDWPAVCEQAVSLWRERGGR